MITRLLIVDDDPHLLANLTLWFQVMGYETSGHADAEQALVAAQTLAFDAAVIDLQLPGMSGLALLQALKRLDPHLPVIVLTGTASVDNAVAVLRHGLGFDFLQKPVVDITLLQAAVEAALAQRTATLPRPEDVRLLDLLSEREREMLDCLALGLQNKDIAERTFISEKTVRNHLSAIYRKLGVETRTQAVVLYQRWRSPRP